MGSKDRRPLSQYMLLIGSFKAVNPLRRPLNPRATGDAVSFIKKENPEFEFIPPCEPKGQENPAWAGECDPETLTGPMFGVRWDHRPKDGNAFILGSTESTSKSASACDFAVAPDNEKTGISRKQIAISIFPLQSDNKTVRVQLTCLKAPAWISRPSPAGVHNGGQVGNAEQYFLSDNQKESIDGPVRIGFRSLEFQVWIPSLTETGYAERWSLAAGFERARATMPPTRLPHIADGPDTLCDNVRSAATGGLCIYDSRVPSCSTPDKPFFTIWYGGVNKWAWQPCAESEETKDSLAEKEEMVRSMWEKSEKIGDHHNIYRFHDTAAYRARGYEKTFQMLPWAIGDELPGQTRTLPNYLEGRPGHDAFDRGLQIFHNICTAVNVAHSKYVAHGHLAAHHVLLTMAEGQRKGRLDVRLYGFKALREKAEVEDNIALGRLGVALLAGRDRQLPGDEDIQAWIAVAETSNQQVQKMLLDLLRGNSSAEHARYFVTGLLVCKRLIPVPGSRKRRATNPQDAPTKQSRLFGEPAPLGRPVSHAEARTPIGANSAPRPGVEHRVRFEVKGEGKLRKSEPGEGTRSDDKHSGKDVGTQAGPEIPETQDPNALSSQDWAELRRPGRETGLSRPGGPAS